MRRGGRQPMRRPILYPHVCTYVLCVMDPLMYLLQLMTTAMMKIHAAITPHRLTLTLLIGKAGWAALNRH